MKDTSFIRFIFLLSYILWCAPQDTFAHSSAAQNVLIVNVNPVNDAVDAPAKKADDTSSVQGLIDAYYQSISGPIGQVRDFDHLKSLFHPDARLIYSHRDMATDEPKLMIFTIDEFIGKLGYLDKKGFYEFELTNQTHSFSSVTQVFSTYEFKTEDKTIAGRGITSYEIYYDGNRYYIMSMFWTAEDDKNPIPDKYVNK